MGLLGFLRFAVFYGFEMLAWPFFALGYPLFASIQAIETKSSSDTEKLVTYWVLFSLISLFEYAFENLLMWLRIWAYIKLIIIFWLSIPHFEGAFYIYTHLVRPCLLMKSSIVIFWINGGKDTKLISDFLVEAEKYVKENGTEAIEKLISNKDADVADKNIDTMKKKESATDKQENTIVLRSPDTMEIQECTTQKKASQEQNLTQTERNIFMDVEIKEIAAATQVPTNFIYGSQASVKVQKEWTCAICQVTTSSETTLKSHLRGKRHSAIYEELKAKTLASKIKGSHSVTKRPEQPKQKITPNLQERMKGKQKKSECSSENAPKHKISSKQGERVQGQQKKNKKDVETKQAKVWCKKCNIWCTDEDNLASHLTGRKHLTRVQELKQLRLQAQHE